MCVCVCVCIGFKNATNNKNKRERKNYPHAQQRNDEGWYDLFFVVLFSPFFSKMYRS